jgi:hypothetical protein
MTTREIPVLIVGDGRSTLDLFGRGLVLLCFGEWATDAGVVLDRVRGAA